MKISPEKRLLNKLPDKLINRKYKRMRYKRNQTIVFAGANFAFAAADAVAHKGFMTAFMGASTLVCLKAAELYINAARLIKPQYDEILQRAKNISKIRKGIDTSV